jgi:hypothetical protein
MSNLAKQPKFKKGDKVRCIEHSLAIDVNIGEVYIVAGYKDEYHVYLEEVGSTPYESRFELVERCKEMNMDFKYKLGDKVRVTNLPFGTEQCVRVGDVAMVVEVDQDDPEGLTYRLDSEHWNDWWFSEQDIKSSLDTREGVLEEISEVNTRLEELHQLLETFD